MNQQKWIMWLILSCILVLISFSLLINPATQTLSIIKLIAGMSLFNLYICVAKGMFDVDEDNQDDNDLAL